MWSFDGQIFTQVGVNAIAGRRRDTTKLEPFRFSEMRPGCFDIDARLTDMDVNGVWASMNFPSMIAGFCGRVFVFASDPEVGAGVRARRGTTGSSTSGTPRIPNGSFLSV